MLRKILATVLVLMMALAGTAVAETAAFNAEGYPIVNEPITLRPLHVFQVRLICPSYTASKAPA